MQTDSDSEGGFKEIKPAPFNRASETSLSHSSTTSISLKTINITLGLAVMLTSLVIVIFFLPTWVKSNKSADTSGNTAVHTESKISSADNSNKIPTSTPPVKAVIEQLSPEEQALNIALRKEAQNSLQEILEKQKTLEENNAEVWAGEDFVKGLNHAKNGDSLYKQQQFSEANIAYQKALVQFNPLHEQIDIIYQENIDHGNNALDTGDANLALTAFKKAALFTDEAGQATVGLERAQKLDKVFANIELGNEMLNEGRLNDAKTAYQTALEIDPDTKLAQQKLKETNRFLADKQFNAFMSAGYAALDRQGFAKALNQFNNALKVKPNASAAKTALQQTKHQATALDIANTLKQAAASETNEQWQTAIDFYSNALKLEKNLAEAQSGRLRSQKMLTISQRLDQILSRPERLSDKKVHAETEVYYKQVNQLDRRGPLLSKQLAELEILLQVSATPVMIQLQSDNLTEVIVYKVGKMGIFESKELSLRPGKYIAIGKRDGYRDVRIEFLVSQDTSRQAVRIAAKDKIN